ncbi:hypothetical protein BRL53_09100 [Corynebacterium ulcerans]|uniref:hypothetical protein n=1 Tax=Corynebacterium ulcerans TaxID=65058 RepID=UPI000C794454|nr:hypothetical protein [Corynebacterium ulcerans]PLV98776.1 hypothetical protein BRL53_09100 [Corynebacterium ulcerans]
MKTKPLFEKVVKERKEEISTLLEDLHNAQNTLEDISENLGPRVGTFNPDDVFKGAHTAIEEERADLIKELIRIRVRATPTTQIKMMRIHELLKLRSKVSDLLNAVQAKSPESIEIATQNLWDVITQEINGIKKGVA